MNEKPILAIETSGIVCGAAVYFDNSNFYSNYEVKKHSHAELLFEMIERSVSDAKIDLKDLEAIAVSNGPGSFTGLRIGMSAAKGISIGANLPIIPIPTFEALALQIIDQKKVEESFKIANKVNMDEVYFAEFQITGNSYIFKQELKLLPKESINPDQKTFGNAFEDQINETISAPLPEYVGRWAKNYGSGLVTKEIDYLEPNYLKNFIPKEMKK